MNIRIFWILQAIVLAFFGLGMLLIPEIFWGFYGASISGAAVYISRSFGAIVTGNTILSWQVRDKAQSAVMPTLVTVFLFDWLIVFVVVVLGQLEGMFNNLMWSTAVVALFWTVVWGYFRFFQKSPALA